MKHIRVSFLTLLFLLITFLCGFIVDALVIYVIVLIHETGHIFFSYFFHYKIKSVTIYPFGGITKYEHLVNSCSYKDIIIYLGGILFQIIIYIIIFILHKYGFIRIHLYFLIIKYNSSIMLFNLIPIIPLDGYLILNYLFNKFYSFKKSYFLSYILSMILIILFIIINVYYKLNNYLIIILFLYEMIIYYTNYNIIFEKFILERYLYHFKFKKYKLINNIDLSKMHKSYYHYFWDNKWVEEEKILAKTFDK